MWAGVWAANAPYARLLLHFPKIHETMVLKRFFNTALKRETVSPAIPPGQRVYAVGDIHGRRDLLDDLIGRIEADSRRRGEAETLLVFLGDLVDRGPDSRGVVERLLNLRDSGIAARFLLGNHDEIFLRAAAGDPRAVRFLTRIGGRQTILSYGISLDEYQSCDFDDLAALLSSKVPAEHVAFLSSFEDYIEIGDYLFVHAGIRPGISLAEQSPVDLRWIRTEFLQCRDAHDKMVIHGHSISDEVDVRRNRIGIDTGAFASGRLTAIGIEGAERWFLAAVGEPDAHWTSLTD